ncbi:MAG: 5-oxoprolinase subunit PxpB [Rhodanobacteraceae bacterium]
MTTDFTLEPLAEDALLLRFGNGIDAETNARVHAAAQALRATNLPGILEVAPAYATLLVRFNPAHWSDIESADPFARLATALKSNVDPGLRRDDEQQHALRGHEEACAIEIPVCYGGEFGPDLGAVADHARLTSDEVIARHTSVAYTVAMLGFAPGFPYLLGLDTALHMPRRANPRTRVPAGSVAIGGAQTGIYPRELPGGWQLLGCTPLALFDPERDPPCLFTPGDRVRFRAIAAGEFARLLEPRT